MNTIKAVIYVDEDPINMALPDVEKLFIDKLHKEGLNHFEVVSRPVKDEEA